MEQQYKRLLAKAEKENSDSLKITVDRLIPEYPRYTGDNVMEAVRCSVKNYRQYKSDVLMKTPFNLKPYIELYFKDADKHYERVMDIVVNLPSSFDATVLTSSTIQLTHNSMIFHLDLNWAIPKKSIDESEFLLSLVNRLRFRDSEEQRLSEYK